MSTLMLDVCIHVYVRMYTCTYMEITSDSKGLQATDNVHIFSGLLFRH